MSQHKQKSKFKQEVEHLERRMQVETIYDGHNYIHCTLDRIKCPLCGYATVKRNSGFGFKQCESNPAEDCRFWCENCDFKGDRVYDGQTRNYVAYDEYCQILVEEI